MTWLRKLLPPPGPLRGYSVISLVAAIGTGAFVTGSAAFFINYVGLSAGQVGAGLTAAGLAGLVASVPAGVLGDRFGHQRVLIVLNLVRAAGFAGYLLAGSFWSFFALVTVIALADCSESPNRRAYLSAISSKEDRVRANAYNRTVFNIGFALGSAGAGVVLALRDPRLYALLAVACAAAYAVSTLVLLRLPAARVPVAAGQAAPRAALRNAPFMAMALVAGAVYMHTQLLNVGLPLWVLQRTSAPPSLLAALMISNTVLVIVLQVRLSRGADTVGGSAQLSRRAGFALLGGCLLWGLSSGRPALPTAILLFAGMLLITLGEIYCSAANWGLSYALAPEHAQGEYLGAWSLAVQFMQALGPVLFAMPLLGLGLPAWLGIGALFAVAGLATVPLSAWSQQRLAVPESVLEPAPARS
ncbi:MFS transporter [Catellatospora sp. TT07R-123]|uniref:MFS transporter n=1 Tax=Catellatospora sp. TT07R-123 TaxID=2733863 RepID=UPI001B1282D9|nr:MFS transporter [Catellatospora sp. TT07R-123]GHJ42883.1 MFS transporter [Catellatospora sp. TT07R-123]